MAKGEPTTPEAAAGQGEPLRHSVASASEEKPVVRPPLIVLLRFVSACQIAVTGHPTRMRVCDI